MRKLAVLILFLAVVFAAGTTGVAFAEEEHQHEHGAMTMTAGSYGTVHFPTSCSSSAQPRFERAVAMLHSFGYDAARDAFEDVAKQDPHCAMAWWGVAMTQYHGLWEQIWPAEGAAAIQKARDLAAEGDAKSSTARSNPKTSARELAYIEALGNIFDDPSKPLHARELAYEQAMAKLHADYPEDHEAAIFYALALDVDAAKTDKTYANQRKARDLLVPIFKLEPNHPGLAHYIIHVSDFPPLAADALPAARRYAQIAPASAHAQHMPSHIFTRMGLWDESIKSNRASAASAERDQAQHPKEALSQRLHALDYLEYAYLQEGRSVDAREVMVEVARIRPPGALNNTGGYADAAIPARFYIEQHEWEKAAALPEPTGMTVNDAITWYAKGLGAALSLDTKQPKVAADTAAVRKIVGKLAAIRDGLAQSSQYWADQVEIQRLQVLAWAEAAEQDMDGAVKHARAAADLEDATEKAPVTPGPIIPAREDLGYMLLVHGRASEALSELEAVLKVAPNRLNALATAARAAAASGNAEKAKSYQDKVDELKRKTVLKTVSAKK